MNVEELEQSLGVTFHDALLVSLSTDYVTRRAEFILDVWIGNPDSGFEEERERRRRGRLTLTGLKYLAIDPPDPTYPYSADSPVGIDICDADEAIKRRYRHNDAVFSGRMFVSVWNGFIHYSAAQAQLTWLSD